MSDYSKTVLNEIGVKGSNIPRRKTFYLNNVTVEVYSIGWLALISNAAQVTIRDWERKKMMPKCVVKVGCVRWYTAEELRRYGGIIRRHLEVKRGFGTAVASNMQKFTKELLTASAEIHKQYKALNPDSAPKLEHLCSYKRVRDVEKQMRHVKRKRYQSTLEE